MLVWWSFTEQSSYFLVTGFYQITFDCPSLQFVSVICLFSLRSVPCFFLSLLSVLKVWRCKCISQKQLPIDFSWVWLVGDIGRRLEGGRKWEVRVLLPISMLWVASSIGSNYYSSGSLALHASTHSSVPAATFQRFHFLFDTPIWRC